MKAKQYKIQAAEPTIARLVQMADALGSAMTPNGIAAMAVFEISRVDPADLWMALGAVRQFGDKYQAAIKKGEKLAAAPLALSR